ncbi:MAG: hypothetical protein K6T33_03795 [Thermomonas hydrothermalis]|nr:hypothetical protein [Thermomonas hydrothermalis]MCL6618893.1 hypothetical protein [Thermomonas hydrothermalis]
MTGRIVIFDLLADARRNHRVDVIDGVLAEITEPMLTDYSHTRRGKARG